MNTMETENAVSNTNPDYDFAKHLAWFVMGATYEHLRQAGSLDQMEHYNHATFQVVYGYLKGTKRLDGSCSDFQCNIALEAEKRFGLRRD